MGEYRTKEKLNWIGKKLDFIVSEKKLKDGTLKVNLSTPDPTDWTLRKKKTEKDISNMNLTVGEYVLQTLIDNPSSKVRGKTVHTIDRKYYKNELNQILDRQSKYHEELSDHKSLCKAVALLYKNNVAHRDTLERNTMHSTHL